MTKTCNKCKQDKPIGEFHKKKTGIYGVKSECKLCCSEWQAQHYAKPDIKAKRLKRQSSDKYQLYIRQFRLKQKYNLTQEQYTEMLMAQNSCCAICKSNVPGGRSDKYFHVDHCHKTNKIRNLLCSRCNVVLGLINDNKDLLNSYINYLDKHEHQKANSRRDRQAYRAQKTDKKRSGCAA